MNRKWRIIAVLLFLAGIFHFVPECLEDPRELAIGSWKDRPTAFSCRWMPPK